MRTGDFISAIQLLLKTNISCGPHISLLVDLASCYYAQGDYENYRIWTLKARDEYFRVHSQLSPETRLSACLGIGKLLEELGFLSAALSLYRSEEKPDVRKSYSDKIEAQILRLACLIGDKKLISENYLYCEMRNIRDGNIEIDMQHALLHADLLGGDLSAGIDRVQFILDKEGIQAADQRLLIFDLLFEALRLQKTSLFPARWMDLFSYGQLDPFEQFLYDLYRHDQGQILQNDVGHLRSQGCSPLCSLRVLFLLHQRGIETASRKYLLLIRQTDVISRNWILRSWPVSESQQLQIHLLGSDLTYNDTQVSLKKSKVVMAFLESFFQSPKINANELVQQIFGLEMSPSIYNRLKAVISKTNKIIETEFGIYRPFEMNDQNVELRPLVKIRRNS